MPRVTCVCHFSINCFTRSTAMTPLFFFPLVPTPLIPVLVSVSSFTGQCRLIDLDCPLTKTTPMLSYQTSRSQIIKPIICEVLSCPFCCFHFPPWSFPPPSPLPHLFLQYSTLHSLLLLFRCLPSLGVRLSFPPSPLAFHRRQLSLSLVILGTFSRLSR